MHCRNRSPRRDSPARAKAQACRPWRSRSRRSSRRRATTHGAWQRSSRLFGSARLRVLPRPAWIAYTRRGSNRDRIGRGTRRCNTDRCGSPRSGGREPSAAESRSDRPRTARGRRPSATATHGGGPSRPACAPAPRRAPASVSSRTYGARDGKGKASRPSQGFSPSRSQPAATARCRNCRTSRGNACFIGPGPKRYALDSSMRTLQKVGTGPFFGQSAGPSVRRDPKTWTCARPPAHQA